ncbi:MAG: RNA-processing protein [Candidatus Aenigmarchaeota archaeon]|nr:RNA-processing protein [Candidatus Aenigmarchaeota archaeon]
MIDIVRIPEDRTAALIGRNGSTKKKIEKMMKVQLEIRENDVELIGEDLDVIYARDIIKAIGRGFSPKEALKLLDDEYQLLVLNAKDYTRRNLEPVIARIIGTRGKAKKIIEEYTRTRISIYGKTVSIIGTVHDIYIAAEAIEMLLNGSPHKNVYLYLENVKAKNKI